jgi:hypothetical protein
LIAIQVPRDKALRNTPRPADRGYMATPPVAGWGPLDDALPDELDEQVLRRQIARVFGLRDTTNSNR